jgi:hypothetical protein
MTAAVIIAASGRWMTAGGTASGILAGSHRRGKVRS